MKKYIYQLGVILLAVSGLFSCINDKGNYSYLDPDDVLPVKITDFPDTSMLLRTLEHLTLTPTVTGMDNESNYEFAWYIYEVTGGATMDTISREKYLDWIVPTETGSKTLAFSVTDIRTGLSVFATTTLRISTEFARGWYLVKDDGYETDLDYLYFYYSSTAANLRWGIEISDILGTAGYKLKGTAVQAYYQNSYYGHTWTDEDGVVQTSRTLSAMHVLSSEDISTFNPLTFERYKSADEFFYEKPEVIAPQFIRTVYSNMFLFLINDGKFYTNYMDFITKFGLPVRLSTADGNGGTDYNITGFWDAAYNYQYFPIYDEVSGNMLYANNSSATLGAETLFYDYAVSSTEGINPADLSNYEFIDNIRRATQQTGSVSTATGFALVRNKTTGEYLLLSISQGTAVASNPITAVHRLDTGKTSLLQGEHRIAITAGDYIYYALGNRLMEYSLFLESDSPVYEFPAGETITSLSQWYMGTSVIYTLVATSDGAGGYKFYIFNYAGSGTQQELIYGPFTGEGTVRHIIFRQADT